MPALVALNLIVALVALNLIVFSCAVVLGHFYCGRRSLPWSRQNALVRQLAQRSGLCCLLTGGVALAIGVVLTWVEYPLPAVHDEFAYLLAGDTYAHGRLANPRHPLWEHFESFHILMQPTYAAKFPPGQGLFLALGQVATGHPIAGVILSCALAAAASCWMLQGWLPARWALVGGLMIAVNPGIQVHWAHTYWGGSVPMLGGCLLIGGLPRFVRTAQRRYAVVMSVGVALLALSRPFEGLLVTLLAVGMLALEARRKPVPLTKLLARGTVAALPVLVATAAFLATINQAVTGDWAKSPYQLNLDQYAPGMPLFVWQPASATPVNYRHAILEKFYVEEQAILASSSLFKRFFTIKRDNIVRCWFVMVGVALTVPFLMLSSVLRRPAFRDVAAASGLFLIGVGMVSWLNPHYLAPGAGLLLLVLMQGCRALRASRCWNGRVVWLCVVGVFLLNTAALYATAQPNPHTWFHTRQQIVDRLSKLPGKHLLIVRYAPDHLPHFEWVYNGADIDGAQVVWAREMDPERNRRLLDYFADRTAWLVQPDTNPVKVRKYQIPTGPLPDTPSRAAPSVSLSRPDDPTTGF